MFKKVLLIGAAAYVAPMIANAVGGEKLPVPPMVVNAAAAGALGAFLVSRF